MTESMRLRGEGKYIGGSWLEAITGERKEIDVEATIDHVVEGAGLVLA